VKKYVDSLLIDQEEVRTVMKEIEKLVQTMILPRNDTFMTDPLQLYIASYLT
jgi:hypothetical protein